MQIGTVNNSVKKLLKKTIQPKILVALVFASFAQLVHANKALEEKAADKFARAPRISIVVKYQDNLLIDAKVLLQQLTRQVSMKLKAKPAFTSVIQNIRQMIQTKKARLTPLAQQLLRRLDHYYVVHLRDKPATPEAAEKILARYRAMDGVEFAYFEPIVEDAAGPMDQRQSHARDVVPPVDPIPDFTAKQFYLDPAPNGVDARAAWKFPGGRGQGVRVMDFETNWNPTHVEFGPTWFTNDEDTTDGRHGTAVWGEIAAKDDGVGTTGITPEASYATASVTWTGDWASYVQSLSERLGLALAKMVAGDVLIIEQHAMGVNDSFSYRPIEYFPAVFDALKLATESGIHCVAAAGNGSENLDDPKWGGAFDRTKRDSGCILVGAVGSPIGGNHLAPLDFSNFGSRLDASAYGENVVTTGYGDLYDKPVNGRPANYTAEFSGTSSATPIVTGAVVSVVGIAKAKNIPLTPAQVRDGLHATGTAQAPGNPPENVGSLPDLVKLISFLKLDLAQ